MEPQPDPANNNSQLQSWLIKGLLALNVVLILFMIGMIIKNL